MSRFFLSVLLFCGFFFSGRFAQAQPERDSIQQLLSKPDLTPSEKWEILAPWLSKKAGTWDDTYIPYADSLVQLAKEHFPGKLSEAYLILGKLHFNGNDLDKSIAAFLKGLEYLGKADNIRLKTQITTDLGNVFYRQKQLEKARDYFRQSLRLAITQSDTLYEILNHINLANTFVDEMHFDSSAYHLFRAKDLAEAAKVTTQLSTIYNNIIFLEDEKGNFENARRYTYELLALAEAMDDKDAQTLGYGNLGYSFGRYGQQYDSAVYYLKLGLSHFDRKYSQLELLPEFYKALSDNYHAQGKTDSALAYLQKYIAIHDTIQRENFDESVQEIEAKYQTEEQEKLLIQAQLETERQNRLRQLTIGISLAVIALLFALFRHWRNRQKLLRQQTELSLKLEQAKARQLAELDQLKSNFFANISHEFRTPLTLILGPIEQLKNNQLKGNLQQYASMMHRNALRLKELINQLLDLSKLESGQMQLDTEAGDIFQFSRQLVSAFESWAGQKELDYQFEIPNEPLWVHYDRDKFEKILNNLISNAIKYTPYEGYVYLKLEAEEIHDSIRLKGAVRDSGVGIPQANQDKIFQRFFQSSNTSDETASSGIGLALTKELIELFGGRISFSSIEGKGTEFSFEIPFAPAAPLAAGRLLSGGIPPATSLPEKATSTKAGTIPLATSPSPIQQEEQLVLVVEDNEDVRNYIIEQVKDQYQILHANNGREGLIIAYDRVPDLIITDLMMPEMTGDQLTLQLKTDQRTSHIPVIILTAKADQEDKLRGLETGADDYLTKPFSARELQLRVNNLMTRRQLLKERFRQGKQQLTPKEIAVNSVDEQFLNRLLACLETEVDNEQLSVEKLAQMVGMSRSQLHRKLTALTDKTPTAFIRSFRMQRAHQLLTRKAGNVSEVAFMVGFSSLAYFSKCFKNEFGLNPTDVLKHPAG